MSEPLTESDLRDIEANAQRTGSTHGSLADAILRLVAEVRRLRGERGDDGEAIAPEWLHSIGLTDQWFEDCWGRSSRTWDEIGVGVSPATGYVAFEFDRSRFYCQTIAKNRGQLRRLCEALGVTLNEAKGD